MALRCATNKAEAMEISSCFLSASSAVLPRSSVLSLSSRAKALRRSSEIPCHSADLSRSLLDETGDPCVTDFTFRATLPFRSCVSGWDLVRCLVCAHAGNLLVLLVTLPFCGGATLRSRDPCNLWSPCEICCSETKSEGAIVLEDLTPDRELVCDGGDGGAGGSVDRFGKVGRRKRSISPSLSFPVFGTSAP